MSERSVSMKLALELAALVTQVTDDLVALEDEWGYQFDETPFELPEWFDQLWSATTDMLAPVATARIAAATYLVDHERDIRRGLPQWWERAKPVLERCFRIKQLRDIDAQCNAPYTPEEG